MKFWISKFIKFYRSKGLFYTLYRVIQKVEHLTYRGPYVFFYTDLTKIIPPQAGILPSDISIECCKGEGDIAQQDRTSLLEYFREKNLQRDMKERFAKGALFWLVKIDSDFAGFIWTIRGTTIEPYIRPLTADDVHFFDNFMFEEFRGRGINPILVNYVLSEMQKQHCVHAFIETRITNTAGMRSLAKTCFRECGLAKKRFSWRNGDVWLKMPLAWIDFSEKQVETQVFESFELLLQIQPEWDYFVESLGCEIFLSYDWCRIWWNFYGAGRDLRVFVFRQDGRMVGVMPLFFENIRLGLFSVRVAKIVGSDSTLSQFSIAVRCDYMEPVLKAFSILMSKQKWDVLCLGPIAGVYKDFNRMTEVLPMCFAEARHHIVVEKWYEQTYFELPDDWDGYLSRLSRNERANIQRNYNLVRRLSSESAHPLESRFAQKDNFAEYFTGFLAMHQSHWKKLGKAGHFGDWPCAEEFHRQLVETNMNLGRLRLLKVNMDNECFGYQYHYKFGQRYYHFLDARPEADKAKGVSWGRITFCEVVKKAIEEKISWIDSMRGRYGHKLHLGGRSFSMKAVYVVPKTVLSKAKFLLLRVFAYILDLCYYRVWYCRIAPKLPIKQKPLWRIWIRTSVFV